MKLPIHPRISTCVPVFLPDSSPVCIRLCTRPCISVRLEMPSPVGHFALPYLRVFYVAFQKLLSFFLPIPSTYFPPPCVLLRLCIIVRILLSITVPLNSSICASVPVRLSISVPL